MQAKKVGVISLGCDKNRVDTEKMLAHLIPTHKLVGDVSDAEVIIINTCAFLESSRKEAIEEILSGYIEPSPFSASATQGTGRCSYCKLAGFCGLEKSKFKYGRVCLNKVDISSFNNEQEVEDGQNI